MIDVLGTNGLYAVIFIVVIAVASLFGLVVFASKEEKFEDVVAAQRKEHEVLIQSLNSNTSKPSKSKKKWSKIKKEKLAKVQDKKEEVEEPGVIAVDEPDVQEAVTKFEAAIETPKDDHEEGKTKSGKKGKNKDKKKKPAAEVVDEPDAKEEAPKKKQKVKVEEEIVEVIEEVVEVAPEVEDLQTAPETEMMAEFLEESMAAVKEPQNVKEETKVEEKKQTEAVVPQKKNKNKKAKASGENKLTVDKITNDLANAQLNNVEVQQLIDALLHKQNELQQWQKPNQKADPMEGLRKQVQELQSQLDEEKNTSLAAAKKNKELRQEMQHEKSQFQKFQSQANQKMNQQAGEIQALQKRMEATQESHLREMQNSQAQMSNLKTMLDQSSAPELQRLKEENAMYKNASLRIQQLTDERSALYAENGQLKRDSSNMRSELDSAHMQVQKHQQQKVHYDERLKALENEIQSLKVSKGDSETVLSKRLTEMSEQLRMFETENKNLSSQLKHAQEEFARSEKVKQEILTQSAVSEASKGQSDEIESLKASLKAAEEKVKHCQQVESQNNDLLKKLAEEKSALEEKLKKEEIVIVESQELNGDAKDSRVSQEEHLQLITEKDKVISELKEDMKSTKEELEKLANVMKQEKEEKDHSVKGLEDTVKELEEKIKNQGETIEEKQKENKKMEEVVEASKTKNNDLREKNWKAMDALATAEANGKKKVKETEEAVFRTLKAIRPNIKLEKGKPIDEILKGFEEEFAKTDKKKRSPDSGSDSSSSSDSDSDNESKSVKSLKKEKESLEANNKELEKKLNNSETSNKELEKKLSNLSKEKSALESSLNKASGSSDEIKKLTEENKNANLQVKHYKDILEETETMLKKLESGVESQVSSYEKNLQGKEAELKQMAEKVKRLEEEMKNNDDKSQLEIDLKKIQAELESEKKAKLEVVSELEEARSKIVALEETSESSLGDDNLNMSQESIDTSGSSSPKKKKGLRHALGKAFRIKSEHTDDAKSKLSHAEESLAKLEADKKELSEKLGQVSDAAKAKEKEIETLKHSKADIVKENAKLKEKIRVIEDSASSSGKSGKEKDAIIAKLRLENAELLEDLREERDRVVVDVESVDSEKLKSELESLQGEYEKEKESSNKLNSSIHELEEELQKTKSEFEELQKKHKETADKLVVSEQRSKDLELSGLSKSERIEKEIDEAIQSDNSPTSPQRAVGTPLVTQLDEIKNQLAEKEKLLESEKQENQQLRAQVAALVNDAGHGTSV